MAIPQIIEDSELEHLIKVIKATSGKHSKRNVALIYTLFGTALMPSEIASLIVSDYTKNKETQVREEIAFNGRSRPLYWANKKLTNAIDEYLKERGHTEQDSPLFLSKSNEGFSFRSTVRNGKTYRSCASLTNLLNGLISGAGLYGCNTGSARRTLAVKLHRKGVSLRVINEILGQSSLTATKQLVSGDSVRLAEVVKNVI